MRCDSIIRCFKAIRALQNRNGVTACELAEILEISKRSAYRYIQSASLVLPVFERDTYPKRFKMMGSIDSVDMKDPVSTSNMPLRHHGVWRMKGSL